jgi:myo-inositol-1(or 4)-monophosphatase
MIQELTSSQWLDIFRDIGVGLKAEIPRMIGRFDAGTPLRRGAGGDHTVLVDEMAEKIILERLERVAESGTGFTLISEECGIKDFGSDRILLLVDPVDGSNNAKMGIPYCATSIALLNGESLKDLGVGYVLDLVSGKEYHAIRGEGAFVHEWGTERPLRTSRSTEPGTVAFEASSPSTDLQKLFPLLLSGRKVRCLGAIALDLALMAAGALDVLVMATPSRPFDFAAGVLLVQEAGGRVTDFRGEGIDGILGGLEKTKPLLAAANEEMHRKALERLRTAR